MIKPLLVYTLSRAAIFAVLLAGLWALNIGSFPGILFALLLSMPLSYFLLARQRDALTAVIAERSERRTELRSRLRGDSAQRQAGGEQ
ncbi:hypothetical protein BH20ACT5_BH20ACT5_24050 [soil metagenome]